MLRLFVLLICLSVLPALPAHAQDGPRVMTDIRPVQSLVAMVTGEIPDVLTGPQDDPHGFQLKPSQARALDRAALTVWIGPALTPWLSGLVEGRTSLILLDVPGTRLIYPEDGEDGHGHGHDDHGHDHDHDHDHGHDHAGDLPDPHAWLDPANAVVWLPAIAEALAALNPDRAADYRANAAAAVARMDALQTELSTQLSGPAKLLVLHDAYDYFATAFGVSVAAAIKPVGAEAASAGRLRAVSESIGTARGLCAMSEVGRNDALFTALGFEPDRIGRLDPLGALLAEGPDLYPGLLRAMATDIATCRP